MLVNGMFFGSLTLKGFDPHFVLLELPGRSREAFPSTFRAVRNNCFLESKQRLLCMSVHVPLRHQGLTLTHLFGATKLQLRDGDNSRVERDFLTACLFDAARAFIPIESGIESSDLPSSSER